MQIFTLAEVEGYEWLLPRRERDFDTFRQLDGRRPRRWKPVPVTLVDRDDDDRPLAPADAPWLGRHVLIVRDDAIDRAATVLADHGELLPPEL